MLSKQQLNQRSYNARIYESILAWRLLERISRTQTIKNITNQLRIVFMYPTHKNLMFGIHIDIVEENQDIIKKCTKLHNRIMMIERKTHDSAWMKQNCREPFTVVST